ncbi:DNA-directed RNA polymerase [Candidatus Woesearchaeota archaeon]|nr:DNA-directed RNA polymerase [Candidatus Woesearchaeota archaeon]MBW3018197.1 DNA-directed RNA polymerase [Candidatus Woesearchaeota archaeon]
MFYKVEIQDHIRVPPALMNEELEKAVLTQLREKFEGYISRDFGNVIDVSEILEIGEGVIIPGDGAPFYKTKFVLLAFRPELQEVLHGRIKDMADFGAFINMGPMDGMIHISQTMDDFVSFSKEKVLTGRDSHRTLKVGDECRARIIAVSFKDISNPKIGVTMRQQGLGKLDWIKEDFEKGSAAPKKEEKETKKK